jgi:hypothetical protein
LARVASLVPFWYDLRMGESPILGSLVTLWPDEKRGPWVVRVTFGVVGGRPGVVGVEQYAVDPAVIGDRAFPPNTVKRLPRRPRRITTAGLRLPLAELTAAYLGSERGRRDAMSTVPDSSWPMTLEDAYNRADSVVEELREASVPKRRGRPPYLDREHFQEVARIYSAALGRGVSPLAAVAEAMHVSTSTASKWATGARRLGLLPPTVPGKATGAAVSGASRARRRS